MGRSTAIAAVLAAAATGAASGCATAMDCSLGGSCVNGSCRCFATWRGPNCSELAVLPAPAVESGGLKLPAAWARVGNQSSWGGSPIFAGGKWHLYAADM